MTRASVNGVDYHYEDRGEGEVLVLLHGAFASSAVLTEVIDILSARDRVIAPDLRGWGGSTHVSFIEPTAWRDDLLALLDHLEVDRFHVAGISLGARVAARLAYDLPQRVLSFASDWTILRADAAASTAITSAADGFDDGERRRQERLHGPDWNDVLDVYYASRESEEFQSFYDVRKMIPRLACPIFVARGDAADPMHPMEHSVELHSRAARSALWIRPSCPSSALMSRPAEFAELYWEFRDAATLQP